MFCSSCERARVSSGQELGRTQCVKACKFFANPERDRGSHRAASLFDAGRPRVDSARPMTTLGLPVIAWRRETRMPCAHRSYTLLALTLVWSGVGCHQERPASFATATDGASDDSALCERLSGRFVGLPALEDKSSTGSPSAAPLAGRWWVRHCSAVASRGEVQVRLAGPGWYFVDERGPDLSLRQQIPFEMEVVIDGRINADLADGVLSVWLVPVKEPQVRVQASDELKVRANSAWGALLRFTPLVPVRAMVAARFSTMAQDAIRSKLREGATATYDFGSGQSDATLGKLGRGRTPERAFAGHTRWLVNDRVQLGPLALHVVGPIAPGPTRLDVNVEQGDDVDYGAICAGDMESSYSALASGRIDDVPSAAFVAHGHVAGRGLHTSDFRVSACPFYLIVSSPSSSLSTLASIRVRA